ISRSCGRARDFVIAWRARRAASPSSASPGIATRPASSRPLRRSAGPSPKAAMRLQKNLLFRNVRWRRLARLYQYFKPDLKKVRTELTLAIACTCGTILAVLARPWPMKIVFDYALIPKHHLRWELPLDIKGYGPMGVATVSCLFLLGLALLWGFF